MKVIENMRDGYVELVQWISDRGRPVAPRGYKTWEVEDAVFRLLDPKDALPVGVGRGLNPAIGAAEALLLCGGITDPTLLTSVTKNMRMFLDGGAFHGAYGPRVRPQLSRLVERLRADGDTRQAIVTVWDPLHDALDTRDVPCTLSFGFRVRRDKLNMSATMRSNDIWLGTAFDVFMFTQLQCTVANALGIDVGTYTHHAYSLHLYERNSDAVDKLRCFDARNFTDAEHLYVTHRPSGFGDGFAPFSRPEDPGAYFQRARDLHAGELRELSRSESWYEAVLAPYDRLTASANFAR